MSNQDNFSVLCGAKLGRFNEMWVHFVAVCGGKSRYFKPKHDVFLTLTHCFFVEPN